MPKESISQYLLRRLDTSAGQHTRIAKESGISQASISRIYRREASPRLETVDRLLDWFERYDRAAKKHSTPRIVAANGAASGCERCASAPLSK
jgi:predicted transcriptional regulator